jgi:hypothetical protein
LTKTGKIEKEETREHYCLFHFWSKEGVFALFSKIEPKGLVNETLPVSNFRLFPGFKV